MIFPCATDRTTRRPWCTASPPANIFGSDGLGNTKLELPADWVPGDGLKLYEQLAKQHKGRLAVVAIGPERYNELYEKLRNLNRLLAWGHARAIENIMEKMDCRRAVTDKFGDERYVRNALLARGKTVTLTQMVRGESDPAVAAASILARAEFLKKLYFLGRDWGMEFPKGASPAVEAAAAEFVRRHGRESLAKVAKVHFRTTGKALGS